MEVGSQESLRRIYYSVASLFNWEDFCCCSKLKREGVKIISQTENVVKEITVHVISVLVLDYNCWLLFARFVCLLVPAQRCLKIANCIH